MHTSRYFNPKFGKHLFLSMLTLLFLMVATAACNLPGSEPEEPVDPDAQLYRMYYDSSTDPDENELQIRQFTGQIRMADVEDIFGEIDDLPQDENGNYASGPVLEEGLLWNLFANSSQSGVNLVTSGMDGTISSALDLDGDGIADILDIWLGDGRRFTFVTEGLGMGVFEDMLRGINPLCNSLLSGERGFAIWEGCADDDEGGGSEGEGGGGGVAGAPGSSFVDPFDQICAEYNASRGFSSQTRVRVGTRERSENFFSTSYGEGGSEGWTDTQTTIYEDDFGNHTYTRKIIVDFDGNGNALQYIDETVFSDGEGVRTITTIAYGSIIDIEPQRFRARLTATGDYDSNTTRPPRPVPETESEDPDDDPGEDPAEEPVDVPPSGEGPDEGNPGPGGNDGSLAGFCDQRESHVSGVEQAAATDPAAFSVSCGDLVGAPASGEDCMIIGWARPGDFAGAMGGGGGNNCGPYEEPDEDGNCKSSNAIQKLKGQTAAMASINFGFINICPLIVCNPKLVEGEVDLEEVELLQEIDTTSEAPGPLVTETPTPAPSSAAEILVDTLCYWGPGAEYGTVGSLITGLIIKIVGVGDEEGWLVVDNPNFTDVSCWVREDEVKPPPDIELGDLPVFESPALVNGNGDSDESGGAPTKPSNLSAQTIFGNPCKVKLNWKDNSSDESGFRIYRNGTLIGTVGANVTTFTDNNATETDGYNYTIRAYNAAGESSGVTIASDTCFG